MCHCSNALALAAHTLGCSGALCLGIATAHAAQVRQPVVHMHRDKRSAYCGPVYTGPAWMLQYRIGAATGHTECIASVCRRYVLIHLHGNGCDIGAPVQALNTHAWIQMFLPSQTGGGSIRMSLNILVCLYCNPSAQLGLALLPSLFSAHHLRAAH